MKATSSGVQYVRFVVSISLIITLVIDSHSSYGPQLRFVLAAAAAGSLLAARLPRSIVAYFLAGAPPDVPMPKTVLNES